jgi:DNA mismatch repair ATPase MutS
MAGKSTFLRAFATNILLSNIGAPVCAKQFYVPTMEILCAIRIDDSLSDGTSYFYAEVKRLGDILKRLQNPGEFPAIFFIDEIFKGTNNKERYQGSLKLIEAFLKIGAFGFVSTHDLALTELSAQEPRLRNMHFREHIEGNCLTFDYTLKEGPCPTTNALFIMKMSGLPV